jgi:hypothetical protein
LLVRGRRALGAPRGPALLAAQGEGIGANLDDGACPKGSGRDRRQGRAATPRGPRAQVGGTGPRPGRWSFYRAKPQRSEETRAGGVPAGSRIGTATPPPGVEPHRPAGLAGPRSGGPSGPSASEDLPVRHGSNVAGDASGSRRDEGRCSVGAHGSRRCSRDGRLRRHCSSRDHGPRPCSHGPAAVGGHSRSRGRRCRRKRAAHRRRRGGRPTRGAAQRIGVAGTRCTDLA